MIVVTGGTGFVGQEICRALRAEGLPVRALARTPPSKLPEGVEFFAADITQPDSLRGAFHQAQAVIHTVGIIHESRNPISPNEVGCGGDRAQQRIGLHHLSALSHLWKR